MIFLIELPHLAFIFLVHGGRHLVVRVLPVQVLLGDPEFFSQSLDFRVGLIFSSFEFTHSAFELVFLPSSEKVQLLLVGAEFDVLGAEIVI